MSHSEKPFACTTEGCNMSFVNEDHLTVHKKKHDMMLNLGINNKNNFFIADQTPTPTRFIRNCEEVGLFQDLQNDNPFEETFRRAVESGKSGVPIVPEVDNDDTLNTPNIFPPITPECSTSIANTSTKIVMTKIDNKDALDLPITDLQTPIIKELNTDTETKNTEETSKISIDTILKEAALDQDTPESLLDNSNLNKSGPLPIDAAEMQLLLKTQDGKVLRFIAAPVVEVQGNSNKTDNKESIKNEVIINKNLNNSNKTKAIQDQKLSAAKMKLKQALTKNGTIVETRTIQNNENKQIVHIKEKRHSYAEVSKKQAILERNRASSMRARAKRKAWIEQLQDSLKSANETNTNLQAQVKSLHAQVAKLKTLLLAHKDCPVTKAMEEGNGIVVGSKIMTIKPDSVKQIPVVSGVVQPMKRPSVEKIIVSKKKPLILSCVKNPIILPKSDSTANTITLHRADTIKTIPTISIVSPLITQSSNTKPILSFVHTDVTKVPLVQNHVTVHETLEKSIASKNTIT